jgi:hypothetical protein
MPAALSIVENWYPAVRLLMLIEPCLSPILACGWSRQGPNDSQSF